MPTQVGGEVANVPRPVAALLQAAYCILLAVGILCSFVTTCWFVWKFFGKKLPIRFTIDKETQTDEESCEESAGSEYFEDTDEEYMRGPF